MRRVTPWLLALVVLTASCGGTSNPSVGVSDTAADGATTSSVTETTEGGSIEGPTAPNFTLALGSDGADSYTLADGAKPVFMVFWAEW